MPSNLLSQVDSLHTIDHISETRYTELVKEVTYEKNKSKLLSKKFKSNKKKKWKKEEINTENLSYLDSPLVKVIVYSLIGILLLAVIYMLLSNIKLKEKSNKKVTEDINHEIENIEEVNTDDGIAASFSDGNYRLTEKTNRHYVHELSGDKNEYEFKNLATVYEHVWYGDKPINIESLKEYSRKARIFITINNPEL